MNDHPRESTLNWRINAVSLGCVAFACFLTSLTQGNEERTAKPATAEQSAVNLMKQSHDGRAVWQNFPGFHAKLRVTADGATQEGTVQVSPAGEIKLQLADDPAFKWVEASLKSLVGHRLSTEEAIQTVEFADQTTAHPLGRLLKSTVTSDNSLWRVQGDVLTEVHRFHGKTRFVISVTDVFRNPEGKHLPKNFNVTTWDSTSGQIKTSRQVFNEWTRIGSIDVPAKVMAAINKDDGTRRVEQIEFTNHELLTPATAIEQSR